MNHVDAPGTGPLPNDNALRAPPGKTAAREALVTQLSTVVAEPIRWLWRHRIAADTLNLLEGPQEVGKSTVVSDILARVTRGTPWPDEPGVDRVPGTVMIIGAEDNVKQVVRPRLDAAGADVTRVFMVHGPATDDEPLGTALQVPRDIAVLRGAIVKFRPDVVYVDALNDLLPGININEDAAVRVALRPLVKLAEEHNVTVIATRHFGKSGNRHAMNAGLGSVGFTAVARVSLQIYRDVDFEGDRAAAPRLLTVAKSNLAPHAPTLRFQIVGTGDDRPAKVEWLGVDTRTADELQASYRDERHASRASATADAEEWLREHLGAGPQPASAVKAAAKEEGISHRTLQRAAKKLGVKPVREQYGGEFTWLLDGPAAGHAPSAPPNGGGANGDAAGAVDPFDGLSRQDDSDGGAGAVENAD